MRESNNSRAPFEPLLIKCHSYRQIYPWLVNTQFLKSFLINLFFSFVISPERPRYANMTSSMVICVLKIYTR
jgi:hypothetical protein